MLRRVIAWSIDQASLVLVLAGLVLAAAGWAASTMPVDVFPELDAPTVLILTESGGLSTPEVEEQVTTPIEQNVQGLPGIRRVRSASATGLSLVWAEFGFGDDIYRARQLVDERLASVRERLPEGAHAELGPVSSIAGEIMLLSLRSPEGQLDDLALRSLAEYTVRPALLSVSGVSQVVAIGGELAEYQVHASPARLLANDLTIADVVAAARGAHETAAAGYLPDVGGEEQPLTQSTAVREVEDIRSTVIRTHAGNPVALGRIASVELGGAPRRGAASVNGHSAVVLVVQKAPDTNTLALTAAIDQALDPVEAALPEGVVLDRAAFRQARFIETAISNLSTVVRDAAIIVAVILLLFLLNLRATVITLTALPLSLAVATLAMWALDMSFNVMTLGGLAVAIGALVDDAIIDVENVMRRLRENAALPEAERRPFLLVLYYASDEVRSAVVFATVIICLVFVPLLFLQGLEGRFFRPLAFSYIVAVLASLVVALTVTPALCRFLLTRVGDGGDHEDGPVGRGLRAVYTPILNAALAFRWPVLALTVLATALSLWWASTYGSSFLPTFNEGSFTVFVNAPPGTSLPASERIAGAIERRLVDVDGVQTVTRRTGRAERDEHAEPVWNSELDVVLEPGQVRSEVLGRVRAILDETGGVVTSLGQPIEHRLSHILSGTPAALAINVYGDDLAELRAAAKAVEAALRDVPGVRDLSAQRDVTVRTLPIVYDRDALRLRGLTPASAAAQVETAFRGTRVAEVRDGLQTRDLVVRLPPNERRTARDVEDLILRGDDGSFTRLRDVARITPDASPVHITHENGRRKAVVSANIAEGHNLGHVVERVREIVDPLVAQRGLTVEYGGQFEAQQSASLSLAIGGAAILLVVLLLLHASLKSVAATLLVAANLPLALIGGVAAIQLTTETGTPVMSVAHLVGFVTLFGIAVRNGILLVNHFAWLRSHEGLDVREAILRGSAERLIPILMTALTAVLGLVPLALGAGDPGNELLAPLAIVVLGGLASSTALNLVVIPVGYDLLFGRFLRSARRQTNPTPSLRETLLQQSSGRSAGD